MRMAFWFFVWRQWLCDGDNGRYLDCFVNLMGPKIWIGSGLFLELYVPLPRLQLQIFFFLFRRKVTHTTYENETHLSFSLFFFDNCDFLVFVMRTLQFWLGQIALHAWVYEIFFSFTFLFYFFIFSQRLHTHNIHNLS